MVPGLDDMYCEEQCDENPLADFLWEVYKWEEQDSDNPSKAFEQLKDGSNKFMIFGDRTEAEANNYGKEKGEPLPSKVHAY